MKNFKKCLSFTLAITLAAVSLPLTAKADSSKVVTLGANLTDEQKNSMYKYFGTSADKVDTIEVNNSDERKYMEGIANEAQIGTRTFSCSYVEPTEEGGIQVKVANLTFVTSSMIASTLLTSGVENCNVVAASPIEVSGTGALTGIMMAYENASGETLDEGQKAAAMEELITTGDLSNTLGQQKASDVMTSIKHEIIKEGISDEGEIADAINNIADDKGVSLTDDQVSKISNIMQEISKYDYNEDAFEDTLDNLNGKTGGFFSNLWNSVKNFFTGGDDDEGGIINNTNDDLLGDGAVIDSTLDSVKEKVEAAEEDGFFDKIINFFKDLFSGDKDEENNSDETQDDNIDDAAAEDNSDATSDDTVDAADIVDPDDNDTDDGATVDDDKSDDNADNDNSDESDDNAPTDDSSID